MADWRTEHPGSRVTALHSRPDTLPCDSILWGELIGSAMLSGYCLAADWGAGTSGGDQGWDRAWGVGLGEGMGDRDGTGDKDQDWDREKGSGATG